MNYTGGFLWMKRVADYIEHSNRYSVSKSYQHDSSKKIIHRVYDKICDLCRIIIYSPNVAIIDAWGESSILVWLILRVFRKNTKIFVVFHHYEERIPIRKNFIEAAYNLIIEIITSKMLKNSDIILTVSKSSMKDLKSFYDIGKPIPNNFDINETLISKNIDGNKIAVVGTGIDVELLSVMIEAMKKTNSKKDIDFLCLGRIEKFFLLEKVWMKIKELRPNSRLVMIGRASAEAIAKFSSIGIEHRGFVSEEEKIELYSRTKVFLFPSSREGFGIAVAEALVLEIPVIAWEIPVFKDLYSNYEEDKIKLVKIGDWESFANESINAINKYNMNYKSMKLTKSKIIFPTWRTVAQNVISIIEYAK
ncbi:MAG TPA: glycosyltransferase family 4 protein [Candidatus Nitrosocosmicus sp.]|nr:glycosyltransferase family 4 protein [Candidatus Nitrosocosmicus sp.]